MKTHPAFKSCFVLFLIGSIPCHLARASDETPSTVIVDTGQNICFGQTAPIPPPRVGQPYYGQDAQYAGVAPHYRDNQDGTVTDLNTGLMWSKAVDPVKVSLADAEAIAGKMNLGGYTDWRVPTIKELYSLIDFRGRTGMMRPMDQGKVPDDTVPYINTDYFDFLYGDVENGERFIDAQWLTRTTYVSTTMNGSPTLFGVNFADGRIKGYGYGDRGRGRGEKKFYVRYVRGADGYGENQFVDNGDGTITDRATGLVWLKTDSRVAMNWFDALAYAETLETGDYDNWRLPNAKELQSIVDYTRSPETTGSPAIDPIFQTTRIRNEAGEADYPYFWTSTTHVDGPNAGQAVYIAFGRAIGQMHGETMDVHGAGAQRSDPKDGTARLGHGPQGDAQRVLNFVRCVRGQATLVEGGIIDKSDALEYPNSIRVGDETYAPKMMEYRDTPDGPPPEMRGSGNHPAPPRSHPRPPRNLRL